MDIKHHLDQEMANDSAIINLLENKDIAEEFYAALCSVQWIKTRNLPEDEEIIHRLMFEELDQFWSCSWRTAGAIIAGIRNYAYNTNETYLDFYCSGNEGHISYVVLENLTRLDWRPVKDND